MGRIEHEREEIGDKRERIGEGRTDFSKKKPFSPKKSHFFFGPKMSLLPFIIPSGGPNSPQV